MRCPQQFVFTVGPRQNTNVRCNSRAVACLQVVGGVADVRYFVNASYPRELHGAKDHVWGGTAGGDVITTDDRV